MSKRIILSAFVVLSFLCACSNSEKRANAEFVEASVRASQAAVAFDAGKYALARDFCIQAKSAVDAIVAKYPDSQMAVSIVTQPDLMLGALPWRNFGAKIIPDLEVYNTSNTSEISFGWAIAVSKTDQKQRDSAFFALATCVLAKCEQGGSNYFANPEKTFAACLQQTVAPNLKIALAQAQKDVFKNIELKKADKARGIAEQSVFVNPKAAAKKASKKIANEAAFLSDARTQAALVSYDLNAIKKLLQMAEDANRLTSPEEFGTVLANAFANSQKITMKKVRDTAAARIAEVFVKYGDRFSAIKIASIIEPNEPFENLMMNTLAEAVSSKAECDDLLRAASKLSPKLRDEFYARLAVSIAPKIGADAIGIATLIKNADKRNAALVDLGESSKDLKISAAALGNIDFSAGDNWIKSYEEGRDLGYGKTRESVENMFKLAQMAERFSGANPVLSQKFVETAAEIDAGANLDEKSKIQYSSACISIARTLCKLGRETAALDFLTNRLQSMKILYIYNGYIDLAVQAYKKNPEAANRVFAICANITRSMEKSLAAEKLTKLAFCMQIGGVSKSDCTKILKPYLPKFSDFEKRPN